MLSVSNLPTVNLVVTMYKTGYCASKDVYGTDAETPARNVDLFACRRIGKLQRYLATSYQPIT
jgi:hypothetical protein